MAQDDPNFPRWAQNVVMAAIVAAVLIGLCILWFVGSGILAVASWIASGSH